MNAPETFQLVPGVTTRVPIGLLQPDPDQPRVDITEASLVAMAADIAVRDIEHAIVVRADFTIKDGERRWRAAQLAGKEDVPVILAKPVSGETAGVDWRLDQVCDNHHREPLNALDWAKVLKDLQDNHHKGPAEIEKLLAARGITMSRSYISNTLRLNDLPDWAKAMIARGVLPPAGGKYILMAAHHAPAMKALREEIEADAKRLNEGEHLRGDQSWSVQRAYRQTAIRLNADWDPNKPRFPWKTSCQQCKTRTKISDEHFCLNRECFDQKQAAADTAKKSTKTTATKPATGSKPDPKAAAKRQLQDLQHAAQQAAREQAILRIADKAKAGLSHQDKRLIALTLFEQTEYEPIFRSRGWPVPKNASQQDLHRIAEKELIKRDTHFIDSFILQCVLQENGYFRLSGGGPLDHVAEIAKRHRIDLKAIERAELAKLKAAAVAKTKPEPKKPAAKKPAAKPKPKAKPAKKPKGKK